MTVADERVAKAKAVADATLFEGYVLYPYRASAKKNQFRWQFGVVMPRAAATALGERDRVRTEVVAEVGRAPVLDVRVRALQVQERRIEDAAGYTVDSLDTGREVWTTFDEAIEHEVVVGGLNVDELVAAPGPTDVDVVWDGGRDVEEIPGGYGRAVRTRWPVQARVTVSAVWCTGPDPLVRVAVEVGNMTPAAATDVRDMAVKQSLVAVHTLMAIDDGRFVSVLDPPPYAAEAVAACTNEGTYPVLIDDDVMLSSPIIMYDRPAVAPESEGDMFDATEIDEILALRVLTLTDEEKREARGTDPRAAAVVDRWESLDADALGRLHGTFRPVADLGLAGGAAGGAAGGVADAGDAPLPWWDPGVDAGFDPYTDTVFVGGTEVGRGARVKLRPSRRADAQDLFFAGLEATVKGVFHDVGGDVYLAVVVADPVDPAGADEPGADDAAERYAAHGRYLYFSPDEVEVLA
ncbi:MAG TPA: hypothetical protein VFA84_08695 [Acidimicrobiales bacterium]|nr:hypothetical protein [Acidimicrobiales bacterium]